MQRPAVMSAMSWHSSPWVIALLLTFTVVAEPCPSAVWDSVMAAVLS
jgi:hypothetical protein